MAVNHWLLPQEELKKKKKKKQWRQCIGCSVPQLKYTSPRVAKAERAALSASCVFFSNESAPAPPWQLTVIYRESGESISSLQGILHNHKRAWQVTWARIYFLLREIDVQHVYMKQAGKILKICQLSRYFANTMTNTGSFWVLAGHNRWPKIFMRQIQVMDYILHLLGLFRQRTNKGNFLFYWMASFSIRF